MNFVTFLLDREHRPEAPFLLGKDQCDYGRLIKDVEALSSGLRERFGKGKEFVLLSDNNYFFILTYLAIIRSGNVVLLIDPRIGASDLDKVLATSDPSAFFIHSKHADAYDSKSILQERDLDELGSGRTFVPDVGGSSLATVVFTSGSTGAKKGVMISHHNLIANTTSIVQYLQLTENDRILVVLPFHYCYGASLLHTHLRAGGSITLFDANFLGAVPDYVDRYKCTGFAGVPSTYQILLAKSNFTRREMPSLRYMTQAGGKLENRFIQQIIDAFPDKQFFVMYGATEATARMSYLPPHLLGKKLGSIGKGIPGVKLSVVDDTWHDISPGQVGEIVAQGENIMLGYYQDPEGTARVLQQGYYCTGDLATVDEEGYIFIVGRCRDIIKSAGYRISPFEIENLVCEVEGVAACAIVGTPDDLMGEAVVAVVVPKEKEGCNDLSKRILKVCNSKLPSYKVPRRIVIKDDLPMNSSNKVDKARLRDELISDGGGT